MSKRPIALMCLQGALCLTTAACSGSEAEGVATDASLYALVDGIDGVYFYPPLGPEPTPQAAFEADLLDGISVSIESADAAGTATRLALFDHTTQPAVALLGARERYFVDIPAAAYVTDPSKTYTIRVFLDGAELASSVLSPHIFDVLAWNPALPIGVHVRIEGSGAVRALPRTRNQASGPPRHCSDGIRNKDETGIDCGGSCAACCTIEPTHTYASGGINCSAQSTGELSACVARHYTNPYSGPVNCWIPTPTAGSGIFCSWGCNGGCSFSGRVTTLYVYDSCPTGYSLSGGLCHASTACH